MSIESIVSIISQYSETRTTNNVFSNVRECMLSNWNGLLCSIDKDKVIYECPNCFLSCETYLQELACCIFRHGFVNGVPLPPHESKENCDRVLAMNVGLVEGCCQPYQIHNMGKNTYIVRQCGYI